MIVGFISGCSKSEIKEPRSPKINDNLQGFEFTRIVVGWDAPTYNEKKTK